MIKITVPDNNIEEREYILKVMFSDFLGLDYTLVADIDVQDYSIRFEDNELVFSDSFFNFYPRTLSYLTLQALPREIKYAKNEFTAEDNIPVIYGTDEMIISERKIICGVDIFASSYFMLTRWEEYVNKTRDEHLRFPGRGSIAFKNGFLDRPVVNEYLELLWRLLQKMGYKFKRKDRSFNLVLTHDIDHLDYPVYLRIMLGDILKRRNIGLAMDHFIQYLSGANPYDKFGFLLNISEKLGVKSHFYFISSDSGRSPDTKFYLYTRRFRNKIKEVTARGHIIGFHPGYFTFNDPERWSYEKRMLEKVVPNKIIEGRQHYLRFEVPLTYCIWEKNGMETDSTMGYANVVGFRCGTGDIFIVFNFLERRIMKIKECPLVLMDGALKRQYPLEQASDILKYYIDLGRKYSSSITFLFHNSTFYGEGWEGYDTIYRSLQDL